MIVVDASALVPALTDPGAMGDQVRGVLSTHRQWIAPSHLAAEVAHTLRGLAIGGKIPAPAAEQALRDLFDLDIQFVVPDHGAVERARRLRHNLSAHDALYVALAEQLECELLTADTRIESSASARCPFVTVRPAAG